MHYVVTAQFIPNTAADFLHKLTDGTIENQKPDGKEIVASMKRAVIDEDGVVRWSEVCYCPTPLEHERETVYDQHFTDIETEEVEGYVEIEGESLITRLEAIAQGNVVRRVPQNLRGGAMKLNVKAFALACGLLWGIGLFLFTWWVIAFDGSSGEVTLIGRLYRGYTISPLGSVIGLGWALVDGLIGGAVFAWLYNVIANRMSAEQQV